MSNCSNLSLCLEATLRRQKYVCFVLDPYFERAQSYLIAHKQQSTSKHVALLVHIISIPNQLVFPLVHPYLADKQNISKFSGDGLNRPGIES